MIPFGDSTQRLAYVSATRQLTTAFVVNRRARPMTITVGETERSELKTAMARARAHPVPWEVLKHGITEQAGPHTRHGEDQPFAHERPLAEFVDLPFGYVVAISFEEQPAGMCLHVSVSGPWPRVARIW